MCSRHPELNGADSAPMSNLSAQWAYTGLVGFLEFIADLPDDVQLRLIRGYIGRLADPGQARKAGRLS